MAPFIFLFVRTKERDVTEQQALQIVRTRCKRSGSCKGCPYITEDGCKVRTTLRARKQKEQRKKSFKK